MYSGAPYERWFLSKRFLDLFTGNQDNRALLQFVSKSGMYQGSSWTIAEGPIVLGRDQSCTIPINDPVVSRRHCQIYLEGEHAYLRDLDSRNATLVNGVPVKTVRLRAGDEVAVGSAVFLVAAVRNPLDRVGGGELKSSDTSSLKLDSPIYSYESGDSLFRRGTPHTTEQLIHLFTLGRSLSQASTLSELIAALLHGIAEEFTPDHFAAALRTHADAAPTVLPTSEADWLQKDNILHPLALQAINDKRSVLLPQQSGMGDQVGIRTSIISPIVLGQEVLGALVSQTCSPHRIYEESDLEYLIAHAYAIAPYIKAVEKLEQLEVENQRLVAGVAHQGPIVGASASLSTLRNQARDAARSSLSVLILGETGSGKELVARMIHELSSLADKPLVIVNCAAIPDELFESEVFGHERGAFTGAHAAKKGLLEESNGGTLFLDEVGDLSLPNQARLLRAIETGAYRKLGGNAVLQASVRVLAATNKNLEEEVANNRFRRDLYHRLNTFEIRIPPLRERRGDIPALAEHFRALATKREARGPSGFEPEALRALERHSWPGNVRELRNVIDRAVVVAKSDRITEKDIGLFSAAEPCEPFLTLDALERRHIQEALRLAKGNVTDAAELLGMGRSTLYRKLAELNLNA